MAIFAPFSCSGQVRLAMLLTPLLLSLLTEDAFCQGGGARPRRDTARRTAEPGPNDAEAEDQDAEEADPVRNYKELPVDTSLKSQQSNIGRMLREGFPSAQAQQFDEYYQKYALARWSLQKDVPDLLGYRKELRNHLRLGKNRQAFDHLNALALKFLTGLAEGDFHPAVRVNAMLAIGELNSVEPSASDSAVPLPEALTVLIDVVGNEKLPDAVRATAMVGVLRHAAAKVRDEEARRRLTAAMLEVLARDIPSGAAGPGREWILGQAVESLGLLGAPGENNAVAKAILKVLANKNLSFSTRTIAASALGGLAFNDTAGLNASAAAAAVAQYASDACAEEQRLSKETGYPVSRRRMKQQIEAAVSALTALTPIAGGNQKAAIANLEKALKDASAQFDPKEERDVSPVVQSLRQKLEGWLQKRSQ